MSQYAWLTRSVFSAAGSTGPKPPLSPASAGVVSSAAASDAAAARAASSFRPTGMAFLQRVPGRGAWNNCRITRTRVQLPPEPPPAPEAPSPPEVPEPLEVYVNGVAQERGADYRVAGRDLIFERSLVREGRLGPWRWLSMLLGIAGTYRDNDAIDVVYEAGGRRLVATGLEPRLEQRAGEP